MNVRAEICLSFLTMKTMYTFTPHLFYLSNGISLFAFDLTDLICLKWAWFSHVKRGVRGKCKIVHDNFSFPFAGKSKYIDSKTLLFILKAWINLNLIVEKKICQKKCSSVCTQENRRNPLSIQNCANTNKVNVKMIINHKIFKHIKFASSDWEWLRVFFRFHFNAVHIDCHLHD